MTSRRDVPTPVLGKLSLSHVGILAVEVEPAMRDGGARETLREVLERELNKEIWALRSAFRGEWEEDRGKKNVRVIAASSDTFVVLTTRRFVEATKMVCLATRNDDGSELRSKVPVSFREVVVCQGNQEIEVLRRIVPMLLEGAFAETPEWRVFGENDNGTRYMYNGGGQEFWPETPDAMITACGVEVQCGMSVRKVPMSLNRDVGEDRELEIVFPSINAVILRLQRLGSVIDAMRSAGVSNQKLRDFINGGKVIDISSTPIMAQAAPEIGVEVAVIAFRRELPKSVGYKSISEFRLAFATRLNTFVPRHAHMDDSSEELLADVCFPGHHKPYLWPVSLLLRSTGATELTARQSNVANDTLLAWLYAASRVPILDTHLSFQISKRAFMSQSVAPKSGPLVPDREIFISTALNGSSAAWPGFSAQANSMPFSVDAWVNPFAHMESESLLDMFSPQQALPPNTASTPSSIPNIMTPGASDIVDALTFDEVIAGRAVGLSPPRTDIATREAERSRDDEPAPILGSRLTPGGLQTAVFYSNPGHPPTKRLRDKTSRKKLPPINTMLRDRIMKTCGVEDVPDVVVYTAEMIESGNADNLTIRKIDASGLLRHLRQMLTLKPGDAPASRRKEDIVDFVCSKLKLKMPSKER